jgi:glycosyltransferase involved in cell wall biosynthesis
MHPYLTVVTVTKALDSALALTGVSLDTDQNFFEWLIKVKGSISKDELRHLNNFPRLTRVLASPDSGIYGAMNQAISAVRTDYVMFLGAGDQLIEGGNEELARISHILVKEKVDIAFLPVLIDGKHSVWHPNPKGMAESMSCAHPGTICRTSMIESVGGFDERYMIAGDYDLISRILRSKGPKIAVGKNAVVKVEPGGVSVTSFFEAFVETQLIRRRVWEVDQRQLVASLNVIARTL